MKKLLSLPPNLVSAFHEVTGLSDEEYFCTCDPIGHRLGSGGGTSWLLMEAMKGEKAETFDEWLAKEKRILVHAGGQSKRLPSYAVSGKVLMPLPVFRWERGQKLSQNLLSVQLPLYEKMMQMAPDNIHTMIVSGDVLIRATQPLQAIPQADVVCYGLWLDASVAKNHGVFVSDRRSPSVLKQMLQKPSVKTLSELQKDHFYLTDIGVWMLSDKAVRLLMERSIVGNPIENMETWMSCRYSPSDFKEYDLYSEFGCALGTDPSIPDSELSELSVAIVPLSGGEFYHFGTSKEMISSTLRLQNLVNDQREIMHLDRKPHPSIFVQNAVTKIPFTEENSNIWVENSYIGEKWHLTHDHVITGVPENDWEISLEPCECIDVVPVGESDYEIRRYHIDEPQNSNELAEKANLYRLFAQRREFRKQNWSALAKNWRHSVFYQLDLADAQEEFKNLGIPLPESLEDDAPLMTRIHNAMFRGESDKAFGLLREGILERQEIVGTPQRDIADDQIVWGRSPVRIDIAGGWTDTPPYCLMEGGNVINFAIELNGQPPLQVYIKPSREYRIVLRSIDLGAMEVVETNEQLTDFMHVGSPFSIPKAALVLAGFGSHNGVRTLCDIHSQLEEFGCGIELTLLSAIPAGSGLGTSSILAATVLGALNDFCGLGWDKNEIGRRTLMLEQMLTTGGGWQDQFGGILSGVKLLQTGRGFDQSPKVRWLPNDLWTQPEYRACHLLYYTGITRTAKSILAEIVRRMFLNHSGEIRQLREMKEHTMEMYEAIQQNDFRRMGLLVRKTWAQNQALDYGTNPQAVSKLTDLIDDLCMGYKLPGAGGGGYLYMIAKDPEAAVRIKQILTENSTNRNARFVEMTLSTIGLQISRS
ncbi:MAG: bifunctional fucokinase/L-fucose-1-P-guanylyltransferase [Prevotella sp.]|nr:bifunctional fucokinase/L-fucose-1-P-guanylyltransferase [Prevotella sp.]MBR1767508.1 bifunctional fucokinase/L-fucose-1-P-guanylyltransferase [Prevotella sp.]